MVAGGGICRVGHMIFKALKIQYTLTFVRFVIYNLFYSIFLQKYEVNGMLFVNLACHHTKFMPNHDHIHSHSNKIWFAKRSCAECDQASWFVVCKFSKFSEAKTLKLFFLTVLSYMWVATSPPTASPQRHYLKFNMYWCKLK